MGKSREKQLKCLCRWHFGLPADKLQLLQTVRIYFCDGVFDGNHAARNIHRGRDFGREKDRRIPGTTV